MAYNYPKVSLTLGSIRLVRHDMTSALASAENISSVTVDDITNDGSATGHLSITAVDKNSTPYTPPCSQTSVAASKAVEFSIGSSHTGDKVYKLKITCNTTAGTVVDYIYVSFSD